MTVSKRLFTRCWLGLTVALLGVVGGCGDSNPDVPTPPEVTGKKFVGKWVENRNPETSPYHKPSDEPDFRMIDLKDDGTFAYFLSDEAGAPKGDAVVEGSWAISGPIVSLKVSKNTLGADREAETPSRILRVITTDTDPGITVPVLYIGSDAVTKYYRKLD